MIALCQYILQSGKTCKQAALKDGSYCRHHQIVRKAVADTGPQSNDPYLLRRRLPFVFPEDRASIQINYFVLLQALNDRRIDAKTAGIMMRVLKATDANLRKGSLDESSQPVDKPTGRPASEDVPLPANNGENPAMVNLSTHSLTKLEGESTGDLAQQPAGGDAQPPESESAGDRNDGAGESAEAPVPLELDEETAEAIHQIERPYGGDPDYGDRIRDSILMSRQPKTATVSQP